MSPDVAERVGGLFDYGTSTVLDAENGVAGNVTDLRGGDAVILRQMQNATELRWRNGNYRAGAALTE